MRVNPAPVTAGQLRHRVTIEVPALIEDALGQRVNSWAPVGTYWAQVLPAVGTEGLAAGAVQAQASALFRLRWRANITAAMRATLRGVVYAIDGDPVDVDGCRHTLQFLGRSGVTR